MINFRYVGLRSSSIVAMVLLAAVPALAVEPGAHSPFLIGVTNGINVGDLPPSGFTV